MYILTMPKLTVALPVYNEEFVLEKSVRKIHSFLSENYVSSFELLIVDNGSTEGTFEKASELAEKHGCVRVIHLDAKGRGRALKTAWSSCDSEIVSYMDIDISTDLSAFPDLIRALESGHDIAIGSRFVPGSVVSRSFTRGVLSGGYNALLKGILGVGFSDAQCGFKAMKKSVFDALVSDVENNEWFFDTELLVKASLRGYSIKEIPVRWDERKDRKSKVNVLATVYGYTVDVLKLRFR
jgi:glycosyltransferase involved in cell wall biosynthesis